MTNTGRELFEFKHGGRRIGMIRRSRGAHRLYVGSINGEECAFGPQKGDLLRQLILMARHYPKDIVGPRARSTIPRQKRGGRPRKTRKP
jgi:hypothetical protein